MALRAGRQGQGSIPTNDRTERRGGLQAAVVVTVFLLSGVMTVAVAHVSGDTAKRALVRGPSLYPVWFNETGLLTGTAWAVTFNGTNQSSTSTTIGFTTLNGTFNFTVPRVAGLYPKPASGSLTVNGASVVQNITWSAAPVYNVTFAESGLPAGTQWVVILAGTHHVSSNNTIVVPQGNGTYNWSVLPIVAPSKNGMAGWVAQVPSGVVKVFGGSKEINVTFVAGWNVTVSESGLPSGTGWGLSVNGTTRSVSTPQTTYLLVNASYTFVLEGPLAGPSGVRYLPSPPALTVTVAGANVTATVAYYTQYLLNVSARPVVGGTVTPAVEWVNSSTAVTLGVTPAPGYEFLSWTGSGPGNYSGNSTNPSITVNGPVEEIATFVRLYAVTFMEIGLPNGTSWSVRLDGQVETSSASSITFNETNGTYTFSIGNVSAYSAAPSQGNVSVDGQTTIQSVTFSGSPSAGSSAATLNAETTLLVVAILVVPVAVLAIIFVRRRRPPMRGSGKPESSPLRSS